MQLDEVSLAIGAVNVMDQGADGHGVESCIQAAQVNFALLAEGQRHVGGGEGGDIRLTRLVGDGLVADSVAQAHDQLLRIVIDHRGRSGGGDDGIGRIADVGHKDLAPIGCARTGAHVLYVEHEITKVLIKNARLNLVGGLRGFERLLHLEHGLISARQEIQ